MSVHWIVLALLAADLPSPPGKVRYEASNGYVVFDHAAHVARRAGCNACHRELPVRRIAIDRPGAHQLCVGCHETGKAGPTRCSACHTGPFQP